MGDRTKLIRLNRYIVIFLLLMFSMTVHHVNASSIDVLTQNQPTELCFQGDVADVVNAVNKAIALMEEQGPSTAFRRLMDPAGGFVKGDLYVFVLDTKGTIVANGDAPQSVGANSLLARDQNGHYFIKDILQQASAKGSGWVNYHWYSPCTGKMTPKQVYFKKAGRFVVCSGFYNTLGI